MSRKDDVSEKFDLVEDLESLSILTGIKQKSLHLMLDGKVTPSEYHQRRLRRYLDASQVRLFMTHKKPVVEYQTTNHGKVPEGYQLRLNMTVKKLSQGDLIVHLPSRHGARQHLTTSGTSQTSWVEVDHVESANLWDKMKIVLADGNTLIAHGDSPVRAAVKIQD